MAFFPDDFLTQIRDKNDIYDVVSSYVNLKRSGSNYLGLCPFHNEKTPSFCVSVSKQIFNCFGCSEGGNVISFIMKIENLNFPDAVRLLAKRANLDIPTDNENQELFKKRKTLLEINKEAARFYHERLNSNAGQAGLSYFKGRGLSNSMIKTFGLGFAPKGWDNLSRHLLSLGYKKEDLIELGICIKNKTGGIYDRFRNRVMFPIIDIYGSVIGFGGRILDDSLPKYMNSTDSYVYNKSKNLFSLNLAKSSKKDALILAEGYMDVIALYKAGFKNTAASLGTSLTNDQARLISRFFKEVIIAYDGDIAGRMASNKAINIFSELGILVRVVDMGDKKDPDDYIKAYGAKSFQKLIDSSSNYIEYKVFSLALKYDVESPEDKIKFLKGASQIIADINSAIERDVYSSKIANRYGVTKEAIETEVNRLLHIRGKKAEQKRKRQLISPPTLKQLGMNKSYNTACAKLEHAIINILYTHSQLYYEISHKFNKESFVNETEKNILEFMIKKFENHEPVDVAVMNQYFNDGEISLFVNIISKDFEFSDKKQQLLKLIDELNTQKLKIAAFSNSQDDDIENWIDLVKRKKQITNRESI